MLANEELGTCVEGKDLVVQLFGDILRFGEGFGAGIVDDNVELTKGLDGLFKELGDFGDLGDVGLNGHGTTARLFDLGNSGQGGLSRGSIVDDDGSTSLGQDFGEAGTKTTASTGDQGNLAIETNIRSGSHVEWESGRGCGGLS